MPKYYLLPIAFIYGLIIRIKNHLYRINIWKPIQFEPTIISIGSLSRNFSFYMPYEKYITSIFELKKIRSGILSTNPMMQTELLKVKPGLDSILIKRNEHAEYDVPRYYTPNSVVGIPYLLNDHPDINTILLSNAYSERNIHFDLNILILHQNNIIHEDFLYPVGQLLEPRKEASRADVILVETKDHILDEQKLNAQMDAFQLHAPVFFVELVYYNAVEYDTGINLPFSNLILFGMGDKALGPLFNIENKDTLQFHEVNGDNPARSCKDLLKIMDGNNSNEFAVLASEKTLSFLLQNDVNRLARIFYLPMGIKFLKDRDKFDALISSVLHGS